jgi:hypothetical protein
MAGVMMVALFVIRRPGDLPAEVVIPIFYDVPLTLAFAVVGAAIVGQRRRHPVGWLLAAISTLLGFSIFVEGCAAWGLSGLVWLLWIWSLTTGPLYATVAAALLLFPTGRAPTRRWLATGRVVAAYAMASIIVCALSPWPRSDNLTVLRVVDHEGWPATSPIGWVGPNWLAAAASLVSPAGFLMLLAAVASLGQRWSRSAGDERQQIKWLALAGLIVVLELVLGAVLAPFQTGPPKPVADLIGDTVFNFIVASIPVAIGLGIIRYRLYDIDILISRTLVFGGLTVFIGAIYVGAVVAGGQLIGHWAGSTTLLGLAATATVALAVDSLRSRLQWLCDRLVFGTRARPYELMARLDRELADAAAPDALLGAIAEAVCRTVRARSARVVLVLGDGQRVAATWPPSADRDTGLPLTIVDDGVVIGEIVVEPAARRASDRALLGEIAAIATGTLRNMRLDAELRALRATIDAQNVEVATSRERLAAVAENERRRLAATVASRIGPDLMRLRDGFAGVESGAVRLEAGCQYLADQATRVVADVRALSRGVLPSVLTDHGISAATRALLRRVDARANLFVDLDPADQRFPTPVETTVYLAFQELVDAAARRNATSLSVRMWRQDDSLAFAVEHDQVPLFPSLSATLSSADRIAALGGVLRTEPLPFGTRVTGCIPLDAGAENDIRPDHGTWTIELAPPSPSASADR